MRSLLLLGSIFGFLAVTLGAFGAHWLDAYWQAYFEPNRAMYLEEVFQTGVKYHMFHALAIFVAAWLAGSRGGGADGAFSWWPRMAGWLFAAGILVFSGSLYALAISGIGIFGAITPIGGVCFLVGWVMLGVAGWRLPSRGETTDEHG
ncbi:MAG: DUF423 domain-containing protein [Rhodospirillales bacterium]|nr:DUF423 domain-containing protein [Rhodospirillales bacterium]